MKASGVLSEGDGGTQLQQKNTLTKVKGKRARFNFQAPPSPDALVDTLAM